MSGATPAGQTDLLAERKRSIAHASSSDIDRSNSGRLFSSGYHLSSCIDDGTQRNLKTAPDQPRGARNRRNGGKTHETIWNHQHGSSATSPRKRSSHVRTTGPTTRA